MNCINGAKSLFWSPVSLISQAANFVTQQTGVNPAEFAGKTSATVSELSAKAMPTLNKVNQGIEGITGYNIASIINEGGNKIQSLKAATASTENFVKAVNDLHISETISSVSSAAKDLYAEPLKYAPWVLGGMVVAGGTYYAYKKMTSPSLVDESSQVGLYTQSKALISSTVSGMWNTVKPGLQYGTATLGLGFGAAQIAENIGPYLQGGQSIVSSADTANVTGMIQLASLGIAAAAVGVKASSLAYGKIKESFGKEPNLVFSKELNNQITSIIQDAKSLQKYGGTFESVYLYSNGNGNTTTAKHIANNLDMNYVKISGENLSNDRASELKKVFENAKNGTTPTLIFIDDVDSMESGSDEIKKILIDETKEPSNKFMLVMTAKSNKFEPELLKNIDHKLHIDLSQESTRKAVIEEHLPLIFSRREIGKCFTAEIIDNIAKNSQGLSVKQIINMLKAIKNGQKANQGILTKNVVANAVKKFTEKAAF